MNISNIDYFEAFIIPYSNKNRTATVKGTATTTTLLTKKTTEITKGFMVLEKTLKKLLTLTLTFLKNCLLHFLPFFYISLFTPLPPPPASTHTQTHTLTHMYIHFLELNECLMNDDGAHFQFH